MKKGLKFEVIFKDGSQLKDEGVSTRQTDLIGEVENNSVRPLTDPGTGRTYVSAFARRNTSVKRRPLIFL